MSDIFREVDEEVRLEKLNAFWKRFGTGIVTLVLLAIAAVGGRDDRTLMVGDSASDIGAARAAKVMSVVVSFGYTEIPAANLGADHLIDHFWELPPLAERLLSLRA